jgi:hypothetical protein
MVTTMARANRNWFADHHSIDSDDDIELLQRSIARNLHHTAECLKNANEARTCQWREMHVVAIDDIELLLMLIFYC